MKRLRSSSSRKSSPARSVRPMLEGLEERLVLSLVAASPTDTKINPTLTLDQTEPSVAMDPNGDYVVAWNNKVGPGYLYDVEASIYNAAGVLQKQIVVAQNLGGDTRPSVAMDANGDFVVAYQVFNSGNYGYYGISAQRYNLAGQPQGGALVLNTGSTVANSGALPQVAMDSTGDFVITYQGFDSNSHGVFAARYNSSGVAQGGIFRVNTPQGDNQGAPSIAMDSAGNFVIAWEDGGTAQTAGVYDQRYNSSGVAQGSNTAISTVAGAANPSVAMEPTGQFAVAWQFNQSTNVPGVEAQRFDASGNALTSVIPVTSSETYDQFHPSVAIDADGDFVVAWESDVQGPTQGTIIAQRVNSGGTLIGPTQFVPSTQTGDSQDLADVASNAGGQTIIVWSSEPTVGNSDQNAFGRLYNYVNDAPTVTKPSNVTINENSGQQTINLSGIAAGGGETQGLSVMATSNNTALINPSITYTSPGSTGTLKFTPAANTFGTAIVTVTVTDNGGTANGGVNSTSVQFTVTVNQVAATVTAVSANWGTTGSAALQTASDGLRLLPSGRNNDLPWLGINKLQITLSQPETLSGSDVSVTGISVPTYGPVSISGSGTNYTITLSQPINVADRVTVTIGNAGITTYTRRLDVLPGDFNDDGVVSAVDMTLINNATAAPYNVFADIDGDGAVTINDVQLARKRIGTSLPALS